MQIDFQKEHTYLSEMKMGQSASLLVEGDIIVPDIKPDIREILLTEANAVVSSYHYENGVLSFTGTANVKILYLPEEGNCPKCIETKFDFKDNFDFPEGEGLSFNVKGTTEHIEFSLINSRKMNVKLVVSVSVRAFRVQEKNLVCDVPASCPLKVRKKPLEIYQLLADTVRELVVSDEIEVPGAKPDVGEIIKIDAKAVKGDCKIMSSKMLLKGALSLRTLYQSLGGDDGVQSMEHEIPFSEVIDLEGVGEDCLCHVAYQVKDLYYTLKENQSGAPRLISLDVILRAEILASKTRSFSVVDDCYSVSGRAEIKRENFVLDEVLCEGVSHQTVKEILALPENAPEVGAVYRLECKPKIQEIAIENGKLLAKGKLIAFVLYGSVEGEEPMYSLVGEFDFTHTVPADGATEDVFCECAVTDQNVSFVLNGGAEIELRCMLEFYTRAVKKQEISLITGCELQEEAGEEVPRGLVIYFAQKGDTLWDIAKFYRTDMEKIIQLNQLEKEYILPGQKILIPKA